MKTIKRKAAYKEFDDVVLIYPEGDHLKDHWYIITKEYFIQQVKRNTISKWIFSDEVPQNQMFCMISREAFENYKEGLWEPKKEDYVRGPNRLLEEGNLDLVVMDHRLINGILLDLNKKIIPRAYVFKIPLEKLDTKSLKKHRDSGKVEVLSKSKNFLEYKCYLNQEDVEKLFIKNGLYYKPITMFTLGRYLKLFLKEKK